MANINNKITSMIPAATPASVFLLGNRTHYQVLDAGNETSSTETICVTTSSEELSPSDSADKDDDKQEDKDSVKPNGGPDEDDYKKKDPDDNQNIKSDFQQNSDQPPYGRKPVIVYKPTIEISPKHEQRSRRASVVQFLTSLSRCRRSLPDNDQYLQHISYTDHVCSFKESCRCMDCQARYFDYGEDSDDEDDDFDVLELENFLGSIDDIFIHSEMEQKPAKKKRIIPGYDETIDKRLEMEVAASTSVMFNLIVLHQLSCVVQ